MARCVLLFILLCLFGPSQVFGATLTQCYKGTCAMITVPDNVRAGEDFDVVVEGYIEDSSSWDVSAYLLMENANWHYDTRNLVQTSSPLLDSKGFNWGGSFSKKYVFNRPAGSYRLTFSFGPRNRQHGYYDVAVEAQVVVAAQETIIPFDIKPQSCPNPLQAKKNGVLSAAIVGTEDFDVTTVDVATIELAGVRPIHMNYEDVTTPFVPFEGKTSEMDCTDAGPDGYMDLTLKFRASDIYDALAEKNGAPLKRGDAVVVKFSALSAGGDENGSLVPLAGEDVVRILTGN